MAVLAAVLGGCLYAVPEPGAEASADPALAAPVSPAFLAPTAARRFSSINPLSDHRLLAIMPDFATVQPAESDAPLTFRQKWNLVIKGTIDPFNLVNSIMTAAFAQDGNQTPKYGEGAGAFGARFGAAVADGATQSIMGGVVFAQLLHQDPRYFRLGPDTGVAHRALYSVSRLVVGRREDGRSTFNSSGLLGIAAGIGMSNVYYPAASIRGRVMLERLSTSFTGVVVGNLMSEFVPDLQKFFLPRIKAKVLGKSALWED
ncbi:MAG TPA: hypothetical protein VMU19_09295 [Bryobacteraceae bacterium]|nr:hypothetical protein [Bryobacteraceae bacterium]